MRDGVGVLLFELVKAFTPSSPATFLIAIPRFNEFFTHAGAVGLQTANHLKTIDNNARAPYD
jgi:hypothetical protein